MDVFRKSAPSHLQGPADSRLGGAKKFTKAVDDSAQKLRFARTVPTQILLGFCVSGRRRPTLDRRFAVPSTPAPMNPSQNWGKVFISRSPISPLLPLPVQPHEITAQNLRLVGVSLNQWKRVTPEAQP